METNSFFGIFGIRGKRGNSIKSRLLYLNYFSRYELAAFISHMGSSSHSGHYVCHIKDKEGRWVIYNDNKVALSVSPPKELGYLYMFKRCDG